ncbi:rhodanese-like domain-containing protein [Timonella sp. A28]|uniref:rhodanese-like domain-containing protein n=1 Tax=Timonella sp. A28 TaxID=3442640 RepID=UPI003EBBA943
MPTSHAHPITLTARTAFAATALAALTALTGCAETSNTPTQESTVAATPSAQTHGHVDVTSFMEYVNTPDTVVIDVRTAEEFAQGHLPGALNIDVNAADFNTAINTLDPTQTYALYCRSGNRSQVAQDLMLKKGFTNTVGLTGGVGALPTDSLVTN